MPERHTWHVSPHSEGGWKVKKVNAERARSRHDKKEEAVQAAKRLAKNSARGQIRIHKRDGRIQEERTYGEDPPETKG